MLKNMRLKRIGSREFFVSLKCFKCFVSLIFVSLLIVPNVGLSISFGAYPKRSIVTVLPGDAAEFEILFFSRSGSSPQFGLSVKGYPEDFIITYPEKFDLNSEFLSDEYVAISGQYIKAKVVKINAIVPEDAEPGKYDMLLKVVCSGVEATGSALNVNAEKTFLLEMDVVGKNGEVKPVDERVIETESRGYEEAGLENSSIENAAESEDEIDAVVEEPEILEESGKRPQHMTGLITSLLKNKFLLSGLLITTLGLATIGSYIIYKKYTSSNSIKAYAINSRLTWEQLKKKWSR